MVWHMQSLSLFYFMVKIQYLNLHFIVQKYFLLYYDTQRYTIKLNLLAVSQCKHSQNTNWRPGAITNDETTLIFYVLI